MPAFILCIKYLWNTAPSCILCQYLLFLSCCKSVFAFYLLQHFDSIYVPVIPCLCTSGFQFYKIIMIIDFILGYIFNRRQMFRHLLINVSFYWGSQTSRLQPPLFFHLPAILCICYFLIRRLPVIGFRFLLRCLFGMFPVRFKDFFNFIITEFFFVYLFRLFLQF